MAAAGALTAVRERSRPMTPEEKKVILASSAGTIFEWYDFYLYGTPHIAVVQLNCARNGFKQARFACAITAN